MEIARELQTNIRHALITTQIFVILVTQSQSLSRFNLAQHHACHYYSLINPILMIMTLQKSHILMKHIRIHHIIFNGIILVVLMIYRQCRSLIYIRREGGRDNTEQVNDSIVKINTSSNSGHLNREINRHILIINKVYMYSDHDVATFGKTRKNQSPRVVSVLFCAKNYSYS